MPVCLAVCPSDRPSQKARSTPATMSRQRSTLSKQHFVLQKLHWPPMRFCIDYKIATLTYKVLKTSCPGYLRQSVHFYTYTPSRHLRSTKQLLLTKPTTRTVISLRSFSRAAPTAWNSLPHHIRIADSFGRFRQSLHIHFYLLTFH